MNYKEWNEINKQLSYFIEYNILPNMISYVINLMYHNNINSNDFFYNIYNSVKSYINITGESKKLVINIVNNILKNKYGLIIIKYNPLIIKRID